MAGRMAVVTISAKAYQKMMAFVKACSTECQWHLTAHRQTKKNKSGRYHYKIDDVLVYKQYCSGGATTTDDFEYNKWLFLDVEPDTPIFGHGHSHVNMPAYRSGRDAAYQAGEIKSLSKGQFFIFLIVNKRGEIHCTVYDNAVKQLFSNEQGNVELVCEGRGCKKSELDSFVQNALSLVHPMSEYPNHDKIDLCSLEEMEEEDVEGVSSDIV